jgi:hypothetical protein
MRRLIRLALLGGLAGALWLWLRDLLEQQEEQRRTSAQRGTPAPQGESPAAEGDASVSKAELYRQAQDLGIEGRSKMNKDQLAAAVAAARQRVPA